MQTRHWNPLWPAAPLPAVTGAALLTGLLLGLVGAVAAAPQPDSACLDCHADRDLTRTNRNGAAVSLYVDAQQLAASAHGTNTCQSCHRDLQSAHPDDGVAAQAVQCVRCHVPQAKTYGASVHGLAAQQGTPGAATCVDCHGSHAVVTRRTSDSPLSARNLSKMCGGCHTEVAQEVQESVHGQALAAGMHDAPTCTDCHLEHRIEPLKGLSPIKLAERICSRCHASERMNTKYRLPSDRVKTFLESYHGLAAQFGSTRAANCASCHGVHRILPSSDPRSSIHPGHLVDTCGKCHPGANANFALGRVHSNGSSDADIGAVLNRIVRQFYLVLIVVVIGGFVAHNLAAWLRHALEALRAGNRRVQRMSRAQRYQHLLLLLSFTALALTGFALKYPDSWLAWLLGSSEPFRRWCHRLAGVSLMVLGGYHLLYVALTREGRQWVHELWPVRGDLRDLTANLRYLAGRTHRRPVLSHFSYIEKIEYWSVVWGTVIMGVTGFVLWFPVPATHFLPRWVVDLALTIHYYEAILATLAIVVWHLYHVILDPEIYPLNWAFWDGQKAPPAGSASPAAHGPDAGTRASGDSARPGP